jgi:hypothetical protein
MGIGLLAVSLFTACAGSAAEIPVKRDLPAVEKPMTGIIWSCGSEKPTQDTEKWLADVDQNLQNNPYISGILVSVKWEIINPEKDKYNWDCTDRLVALAAKYNKTYKIKMQPGVATPAWVYEAGAQAFTTKVMNEYRSNFGESVRIPLPWDRVYLTAFKGFLKAVAARYGQDEHCSGIVISGVNFSSSEMHLPYKSPGDMKQWESHGDYKTKIVKTYQELLDYYAVLFQGKQIFLHVSGIIGGMKPELDEIVTYGVENYPASLTLQNCQMNGKWNNKNMESYRIVTENNKKVHVGFQSVAKLDTPRMGTVENSVFNYCQGKGEYWEVWQGDGNDIDICRRIDSMVKECNKIGLKAYREKYCKDFPEASPPNKGEGK